MSQFFNNYFQHNSGCDAWSSLKIDLLDYPGGRKKHPSATPLIGGLAIYLTLIGSVVIDKTGRLILENRIFGHSSFLGRCNR